jgi:hypothetical protein
MHDVLIALIEKLPHGYLMAALPVAAVAGVWVFAHLRRDKQGKLYFYTQKYEDNKRNRKQDQILQEIKSSKSAFEDVRKDVLQLQVCSVDLPKTAKRLAYHKYKQRGYNGWMDEYVVEKGLFTKEEVTYVSANKEDV